MRERGHLQAFKNEISGIGLEAHIVELYPVAISTFLSELQKPYFLDPVLYKFGETFFGEYSEKRWVEVLTSEYGLDPILTAHGSGFDIAHLVGNKDLRTIVSKILDYQRTRLPNLSAEAQALSMLSGEAEAPEIKPPEFLVAPYIIINDAQSLNATKLLARISLEQRKTGERVFVCVALARNMFTNLAEVHHVVDELRDLKPDGFLVWACDFEENREDSIVLDVFETLCHDLGAIGKGTQVINLFGGYYSVVLSARELLSGSVQGIGMSEYRDPFAAGGGGRKRYYIPKPHQLVGVDRAYDLYNTSRDLFWCGCEDCKAGGTPKDMTVAQLTTHAIRMRVKEFKDTSASSIQGIIQDLENDSVTLAAITEDPVRDHATEFSKRLHVWAERFKALSAKGWIK